MSAADSTGALSDTIRAARSRAATPLGIATIAIMVVGLALRIVGARGELWLDEIFSLHLIDDMKARGDVLSALPIDNNHYLNTLYLYLVGPDAPPLVQRALSLLLGTATVAAAGLIQFRRGVANALAAMALFAITYPLVNAGSEARGYAGMILCALLAIGAAENAMHDPNRRRFLLLGAVNLIGILFQPIMIAMTAALIGWIAWDTWQSSGSLRRALVVARDTFAWTVRFLIPVIAIIGFAVLHADGYVLGGVETFSPAAFASGLARMFQILLGLPDGTPPAIVIALVLALVGVFVALQRRAIDSRVSLYLIIILGLPIAMFCARLPNAGFARYYLLPATIFLLLLSDLFGRLWHGGVIQKCLGGMLIGGILVGNAVELGKFFAAGHGGVSVLLQTMTGEGPARVTSNTDLRDRTVIEYLARKQDLAVTYVLFSDVCKDRPGWLLTSDFRELPDVTTIGAPDCSLTFKRQAEYHFWGLSGSPWTLYKAAD